MNNILIALTIIIIILIIIILLKDKFNNKNEIEIEPMDEIHRLKENKVLLEHLTDLELANNNFVKNFNDNNVNLKDLTLSNITVSDKITNKNLTDRIEKIEKSINDLKTNYDNFYNTFYKGNMLENTNISVFCDPNAIVYIGKLSNMQIVGIGEHSCMAYGIYYHLNGNVCYISTNYFAPKFNNSDGHALVCWGFKINNKIFKCHNKLYTDNQNLQSGKNHLDISVQVNTNESKSLFHSLLTGMIDIVDRGGNFIYDYHTDVGNHYLRYLAPMTSQITYDNTKYCAYAVSSPDGGWPGWGDNLLIKIIQGEFYLT